MPPADAAAVVGSGEVCCLMNTTVVSTASPFAFLPVWWTVKVLPSLETTAWELIVGFPSFFQGLS